MFNTGKSVFVFCIYAYTYALLSCVRTLDYGLDFPFTPGIVVRQFLTYSINNSGPNAASGFLIFTVFVLVDHLYDSDKKNSTLPMNPLFDRSWSSSNPKTLAYENTFTLLIYAYRI